MSQEDEDKGPTATVDSYDYTELKDYDEGEGSFPHVDHSLDNGVRPGMIVEMPLESGIDHWPTLILRGKYINQETEKLMLGSKSPVKPV